MSKSLENSLNEFLAGSAIIVPGLRTKMQDFVDAFSRASVPARWPRRDIVVAIDDLIANDPAWAGIVRGRAGDNYDSLGNVTLPHHQYERFNGNDLLRVVI